ncbi:MAG: alpha/beta hydrolase-fold protein [Planctomycetota bacterium]
MRVCVLLLAMFVCATAVRAQERETVVFETTQQTTFGQSVFVLGDIPELGSNDLTRAIKLEPSAYPTWRIGVAIPEGVGYSYRYYVRNDAPGQTSSPANGTPVSGVLSGSVPADDGPVGTAVLVRSDLVGTHTLRWRGFGDTSFTSTPMEPMGDGTHFAISVARDHASDAYGVGFFIEGPGGFRSPASGTHTAVAPGVFVQDDRLFTYRPAQSVSPARRDHNPASPPTIFSNAIGETRRYRVYLPRGYDEHPDRVYPLVFFHDGQNVFESGAFGSWNADEAIVETTDAGLVREAVYVAVDHTDRFRDFIPGLGADRYIAFLRDELTPLIASQYRVRTDAANVGVIGSSLGGVISMEMGWNHPQTFGLVGALSGAWQVTTTTLNQELRTQPARDVRIYMDSGDAGASNDNYWLTYGLRDSLAGGASPRYGLGGSLGHVVGFGDAHNEPAWDRRLPGVLAYLLPSREDENGVINNVVGPQLDRDGDGSIGAEDLYLQNASPADLNNDGDVDLVDGAFLRRVVRRAELPNR